MILKITIFGLLLILVAVLVLSYYQTSSCMEGLDCPVPLISKEELYNGQVFTCTQDAPSGGVINTAYQYVGAVSGTTYVMASTLKPTAKITNGSSLTVGTATNLPSITASTLLNGQVFICSGSTDITSPPTGTTRKYQFFRTSAAGATTLTGFVVKTDLSATVMVTDAININKVSTEATPAINITLAESASTITPISITSSALKNGQIFKCSGADTVVGGSNSQKYQFIAPGQIMIPIDNALPATVMVTDCVNIKSASGSPICNQLLANVTDNEACALPIISASNLQLGQVFQCIDNKPSGSSRWVYVGSNKIMSTTAVPTVKVQNCASLTVVNSVPTSTAALTNGQVFNCASGSISNSTGTTFQYITNGTSKKIVSSTLSPTVSYSCPPADGSWTTADLTASDLKQVTSGDLQNGQVFMCTAGDIMNGTGNGKTYQYLSSNRVMASSLKPTVAVTNCTTGSPQLVLCSGITPASWDAAGLGEYGDEAKSNRHDNDDSKSNRNTDDSKSNHHYDDYLRWRNRRSYSNTASSYQPSSTTPASNASATYPQNNTVQPQVAVSDTGYDAMSLQQKSDLLKNIQKIFRNELIANRSTDASVMDTSSSSCSDTDSTEQGQEYNKVLCPSNPNGSCPPIPDMTQYIKKDAIPCWGCSVDY